MPVQLNSRVAKNMKDIRPLNKSGRSTMHPTKVGCITHQMNKIGSRCSPSSFSVFFPHRATTHLSRLAHRLWWCGLGQSTAPELGRRCRRRPWWLVGVGSGGGGVDLGGDWVSWERVGGGVVDDDFGSEWTQVEHNLLADYSRRPGDDGNSILEKKKIIAARTRNAEMRRAGWVPFSSGTTTLPQPWLMPSIDHKHYHHHHKFETKEIAITSKKLHFSFMCSNNIGTRWS